MQPSQALHARRSMASRRSALWLGVTLVVLAWSVVQLFSLLSRHTIGPEIYGILVAALAVLAGILSLVLVASTQRRMWQTGAVLVLWGVVAFGGVAGMVAHVVGPSPGHGPVDTRPRPVAAPLIFTVLGAVGGVALYRGQRTAGARVIERGEE